MHTSSLIINFSLSNTFWHVEFQVHSVLLDIICLSNSNTSAVLGENLFKKLIIPRNAWNFFYVFQRPSVVVLWTFLGMVSYDVLLLDPLQPLFKWFWQGICYTSYGCVVMFSVWFNLEWNVSSIQAIPINKSVNSL